LEINSNNFMFKVVDGNKFLLKRIAVSTELEKLEIQYGSSEILRLADVPMPEVLANDAGSLVTIDRNQDRWTLTRFVEGDYYSGEFGALTELGSGLGRIMKALNSQNQLKLPINSAVGGLAAFEKSFLLFVGCKTDWDKFFPVDSLYLLYEHEKILCEVGEDIVNGLQQLSGLPLAAGHTDLHPHNVLVRNGQVAAFVDVDALQVNIRILSIAFAMYKLLRQYAVSEGFTVKNIIQIRASSQEFLRSVIDFVELSNEEIKSLKFAAQFEIYRRFLIISSLNIVHGDTAWNKVMPLHLAALHEIPIIFE